MVCGSMGLNTDMKAILEDFGLNEGANSEPAEYVIEYEAGIPSEVVVVANMRPPSESFEVY